ncbi:haloacid dehalogenase-like hydrolase family member protein, putative [Babesia ovis]|uniref:Haloacid dehalogenase-like hydrolase family member protein, putative n=1 Tax=Babesia ovis TaxID=5869 RepID=A0A9W5TDU3_BABOV|nr:haloacid dehalogenase-like hydrolase family member protein, putative [Babesia ovis]
MAKNIRAFGQAVEQGKTLFFATGRTITDARRLLVERALAAMSYSGFPGVYSDGAMVFDDYGNLISETYLDSSLVEKLASEAAKDCKKYAPVLFTAYKTYLM